MENACTRLNSAWEFVCSLLFDFVENSRPRERGSRDRDSAENPVESWVWLWNIGSFVTLESPWIKGQRAPAGKWWQLINNMQAVHFPPAAYIVRKIYSGYMSPIACEKFTDYVLRSGWSWDIQNQDTFNNLSIRALSSPFSYRNSRSVYFKEKERNDILNPFQSRRNLSHINIILS